MFGALARWWRRPSAAARPVLPSVDGVASPSGSTAPVGSRRTGRGDRFAVPVPEFQGRIETQFHAESAVRLPAEGGGRTFVTPAHAVTIIHVDRPCTPVATAPDQAPRCSETPNGDFYTNCETCLMCDQFRTEAPDLIAYVEHPGTPSHAAGAVHCAFVRQPRTPDEIERAIDAMCGSEVCGIRYGGRDPEILRRIAARGSMADGTTDHPLA